jgi:hypothetical protein
MGMLDLTSLGLMLRNATASDSGERRTEVRIKSTDTFIAWFRSSARLSDGDEIVNVTMQFVRRKELTDEQVAAVKEWLREQASTVL